MLRRQKAGEVRSISNQGMKSAKLTDATVTREMHTTVLALMVFEMKLD
jgi:hypothetical protein